MLLYGLKNSKKLKATENSYLKQLPLKEGGRVSIVGGRGIENKYYFLINPPANTQIQPTPLRQGGHQERTNNKLPIKPKNPLI